MEILYWSPRTDHEEEMMEAMRKTYERIHTYKDEEWYGQSYEDVDDVLKLVENRKQKNIFDPLD